jgi:hypothetical protein
MPDRILGDIISRSEEKKQLEVFMSRGFLALTGLVMALAACGCSTGEQQQGSEANAAQSQPYSPGTGVSSSSFDRHPRFYTGPNGQQEQSPATQPATP